MKGLDQMLSEDLFQFYCVAAPFLLVVYIRSTKPFCGICKVLPSQCGACHYVYNSPSFCIVALPWSPGDQLSSVFQGILSDDHGLAAALWRTFFNQKCEDPRQLELLVEYVRKQVSSPTPLPEAHGKQVLPEVCRCWTFRGS